MQLLLIRHAIAADRYEFARTGRSDSARPLTDKGSERMRRGAAGLARLIPGIDLVLHSPLARAVQTADILEQQVPCGRRRLCTALSPGNAPARMASAIAAEADDRVVALVGHEPGLGELAAWLLVGSAHGFIEFKKGAVLSIDCPRSPTAVSGSLRWLLAPRQLRLLGATRPL